MMLSSQRAWQNFYLRSGVRRSGSHQFTTSPLRRVTGFSVWGCHDIHKLTPEAQDTWRGCHFKKLGYAVQGLYNQIDSVSYCIRFYYIIFHFTTVYCISLCIVLYCIVLYCIVLYCIVLYFFYCTTLYYIALICKTILYNLYTYLIYNMMFYDHMYTCHVPIHG